jgi:L-alanine-DL-glutamate epimerase-like enolase superfamily enzyme
MFLSIRSSGRKGVALLAISHRYRNLGPSWENSRVAEYKLLGGTKRKIPAYASVGFLSMPVEEVVEKSLEYITDGYKTLKIKVGYDGGKNIIADAERIEKVRKAVGDGIEIIIDANGIYDAATAIRFAEAVSDYHICLFEEPTHADDIMGLRRVREATTIPIASGENEYTKYGCRDLLLAQAVDVLQFDITRVGGFTEMVKISAMTQAWNLKLAPHFWPQFSAHLMSPAPHGLYLEVFPTPKGVPAGGNIITNQPAVVNGFYEIPERPGMGLNYDVEYLQKFRVGNI